MRGPRKSKPVGVLSKTFQILDLVQNSARPLNLKEISAQSGINKSTALRILAHLEAAHYVSRNAKSEYSAGIGAPERGGAQWHSTLRRIARLPMWELWRSTLETVNLGVLEGLEVVYLECLESPHEFRLVAHVGMRAALHRTALGKAILAWSPVEKREMILETCDFEPFTPNTIRSPGVLRLRLEEIREAGYAVDDEESHLGLRCIAAPILNAAGLAMAAISISGPTARLSLESVRPLATEVRSAAQAIAAKAAALGLA
ncbi:MAG: IclR family transcriptional regulator [Bryobacteraceae bacterium]